MADEKDEGIGYIIPRNVKTRFQFFPGFGWIEILIIALGICAGFLIFVLLGVFTKSLTRIIAVLICAAASFFLVSPDPKTGTSLLKMLKDFKNYKGNRKRYLYIFGRGRIDGYEER